ncbi:hypothetical protein HNP46_006478 [Pseudomonas nitritireducens]|uniref:Uncharacterized protein n=1 Tax=Pseudomonas nitroreducens TaxID=46680 RepID=A0A7W7KS33_PSENT|nr:hypothetical protein [Pseudomonas nitritireducens]MBB4867564.1 hypothetical protein [Pseudomonas nitritireducens]
MTIAQSVTATTKVIRIEASLAAEPQKDNDFVQHVVREYMALDWGTQLKLHGALKITLEKDSLLKVSRHPQKPFFEVYCTQEQLEQAHAALRDAYTRYATTMLERMQRIVERVAREPERVTA